jgi:hypothetical protein
MFFLFEEVEEDNLDFPFYPDDHIEIHDHRKEFDRYDDDNEESDEEFNHRKYKEEAMAVQEEQKAEKECTWCYGTGKHLGTNCPECGGKREYIPFYEAAF